MDFMTSLLDEQHMIRVINGKTVILTKITDSINTKMNSLFSTLAMVNTNFKRWQVTFQEESSIHDCRFDTFSEFFSKFFRHSAMDKTVLDLHYQSLLIPPPSQFNRSHKETQTSIAALAAALTHHPAIRELQLDERFKGMPALN